MGHLLNTSRPFVTTVKNEKVGEYRFQSVYLLTKQ